MCIACNKQHMSLTQLAIMYVFLFMLVPLLRLKVQLPHLNKHIVYNKSFYLFIFHNLYLLSLFWYKDMYYVKFIIS